MTSKKPGQVAQAIEALAEVFEDGALEACTMPSAFLERVRGEVVALRAQVERLERERDEALLELGEVYVTAADALAWARFMSEPVRAAKGEALRACSAMADALHAETDARRAASMQRDAARRELAELRAVLRDLEWSGEDDAEYGGKVQCCPLCEARPALEGNALVGHTADCRLGVLLAPPAERGDRGEEGKTQ